MNELVRLTTQDVGKAIPITDSLIIAEKYQVLHKTVTNTIRKYFKDFEEFGKVKHYNNALESNKETMIFVLNEEQFYLLVTYMKNTEVARFYKKEFIKQFSKMKKELMARLETRHIAVSVRKNLTDTIKKCLSDESNFKKFSYGTYTKLVYKKIIGKDVKKIKEERNVKENENVRDYFTIEELDKIQELESKIATFIEFTNTEGKDDKQIYQMVKLYLEAK